MDHHSELEMAVNPRKRSKIEEEVLLNKEAIVMARGPEIRRHSSPVNLNEQLKSPSENFTDTFLPNLVSGLSVAFVNLPMCMAFASAARLSPTNGIISAFWSSLFVWFSDSKYSVISVAMSIALLTGPMVTSYGEDGYHMALFFSGLIIMFLLFTKLYKYMIIIPKCVMDGFLAGCVLGVFVEQLPTIFMVDFEKPAEGESSEGPMISMFVQGMTNVYMQRQDVNWLSVFIYFAVTICLYVLMKKAPSRPWVLFMCIFGILIGVVEDYVGEDRRPLLRLSEKYSNIKLRFFTFPSIGSRSIKSMITNPQFYFDTLSMSMLIILEGMIAWGMLGVTTDQTFTSTPKNILVLIYCNLSCIVTGTMGASFVYARSILNYQTGAKNQFACIINGIICLGVGFLFFSLFSKMPSVVLEGILMGLELKVVRVKKLIFAFKHDFKFFITSMSVIFAMLFTRGSNAIFIGLFVYLAMFTKELMTPQNEVTFTRKGEVGGDAYLESSIVRLKSIEEQNYEIPDLKGEGEGDEEALRKRLGMKVGSRVFLYRIVGLLTYLNVPQHSYKISRCGKKGDLTIISFRYVTIADHDGLLALMKFIEEQEKKGVEIVIAGIKRKLKKKIETIKGLSDQVRKRSWHVKLITDN